MDILLRFFGLFRPQYLSGLFLAVILVLSAGLTVITPFFYQQLVDMGIYRQDIKTVIQMVVLIAASLVLRELLFLGQTAITLGIREAVFSAIRLKLYSHLMVLPPSFFSEQHKGRLLSRLISDVDAVQNLFLDRLILFSRNMLVGLFILAITLIIDWKMVLAVTVFLPLLYVLYLIFRKNIARLSQMLQEKRELFTERLQEDLAMVKAIQSFAVVKERMAETIGYLTGMERAKKRLDMHYAFASSSTIIINLIGILVIWGMGALRVMEERMTIGTLVAISFFLEYVINLFYSAYYTVVELQSSIPAARRILEVLDAKPVITDREDAVDRDFSLAKVEIVNVSFAYVPGNYLFKEMNLKLYPGDILGVIGENGQGKTTFANLLQRFIEPEEGLITFDGIDIKNIKLDVLRRTVAVIAQEDFLFHQSLRDNILLHRSGISETQFLKACALAKVDEFAERLPAKYDTIVGERGAKLSGGEKKRVAIARALLDNPYILILDEATSMLDKETEQAILETVVSLAGDKIVIIITHKISNLKYTNRVIRIHEGAVESLSLSSAQELKHGLTTIK